MNNRQLGKQSEELIQYHYQQQGRIPLEHNFTIRWGEIDLLMEKEKTLVLIEVKTINHIDELDHYISSKKIWFLQKTLAYYLQNVNTQTYQEIRIDVAFIKQGKIIEIYENITNT